MNSRIARKIRQVNRRNWREYLSEIKDLPFMFRWRLAWWIVFGKKIEHKREGQA